jgi:2-amino-4-hydroxy-6-hydroxymethyldihydropteridine diphosphokinase
MTVATIGLGANLGEPRRQLQAAIEALAALPGTQLLRASTFYRSAPVGHADQPDFVNAVAQVETTLAPEDLLDRLQEIERRHGRERPFPGAPRTLDLDLLLYGDAEIATPRLTVPHPRMHARAFVLRPLARIAPQATIPGRGAVEALLQGCREQVAEPLD